MTKQEIEAELAAKEKWIAKNWSVEGLHETALRAIRGLYARTANDGDTKAAHALADLGNYISQALSFSLTQTHEATPGNRAVNQAAADSYLWPTVIPAMEEMRINATNEATPANLGVNLPIKAEKRKGKGRTRVFINSGQTGFAFNVFCSLESRRGDGDDLQSFTLKSLPEWIARGVQIVNERPDLFPDTIEMRSATVTRMSKMGQDEESAREHVVKKMLKAGFKQLLKA